MRASKIRFPILKTYFKVIKKNLPSLLIYIVIFLAISVLMTKFNGSSANASFQETKTKVVFLDKDNTPLTKGLKDSLDPSSDFFNYADNKEDLSDALFFHTIQYIVRIPEGFTQKFLNGENVSVEKTVGQNAISGVNIDLIINNYFSTARLYNKNIPDISQDQLVKYVKDSISQKTEVTTKSYGSSSNLETATPYFNFASYSVLVVIFLGVSTVMLVFNKKDLRNRNLASPVKSTSMSIQIFIGHFVLMLIAWIFAVILSLFLCGTDIIGKNFALLCLNLLCVSIACLSISFFIANFITNRGVLHAVTNVLSLGLSFVSGIFVPQELLSGTLLSVAHFTPTYWYVKATNDIGSLSAFNSDTLSPIFNAMLIQIGFAAAFFALTMAVSRQRKAA
jgi:ABC-2 type transport system permease protein